MNDFPFKSDPKSWSPLLAPRPPIPTIFPWTRRSTIELIGMLLLAAFAMGVAIAVPDPADNILGVVVAVGFIGAWVAWLLLDVRTLRRTLGTLPRFEPAQRPRLHLPMRHLMAPPYLAAIVLTAALGGLGLSIGVVFVVVFWVAAQVSNNGIAYVLLPRDSIEASLQRDAAAISFLVLTAVFSAACIGGPLLVGIHIPQSGRYASIENLAMAPFAFAMVIYGITYYFLKRRVG